LGLIFKLGMDDQSINHANQFVKDVNRFFAWAATLESIKYGTKR